MRRYSDKSHIKLYDRVIFRSDNHGGIMDGRIWTITPKGIEVRSDSKGSTFVKWDRIMDVKTDCIDPDAIYTAPNGDKYEVVEYCNAQKTECRLCEHYKNNLCAIKGISRIRPCTNRDWDLGVPDWRYIDGVKVVVMKLPDGSYVRRRRND